MTGSSTFELIVTAITAETPLIRAYRLRQASGASLPPFAAGSHLKVMVPTLADPRHYSLMRLDADRAGFDAPMEYLLGVRLEETTKGGSRYMHGLSVGDKLTVSGPHNDFPLHEAALSDVPTVLVAGGIGITPIAAMASALSAAGRPYLLHYSGRSRDQLAYVTALTALAGDSLVLHADDEAETRLNVSRLLDDLIADYPPASTYGVPHLYVCGPKGLIDAVIDGARQRDWPVDRVHFELFTAATPLAGDRPFEVELRSTGQVLTVPADKTILEVMEAAGLDPMFDCKRGECGVCQATVLEGVCDHRDYVLSDSEKASGNVIQICISRAKSSRLVLDL